MSKTYIICGDNQKWYEYGANNAELALKLFKTEHPAVVAEWIFDILEHE